MRIPDRDALLKKTYRLNHELGYIGFRHQYFNDAEAIAEWPDPAVRERGLRGFWDEQRDGSFASYYNDFAHYSVNVLAAYCDYLRDLVAGSVDRQIAYCQRVSKMGRSRRLHENGSGAIKADKDRLPSPGELAEVRGVDRPESSPAARGHDRGNGR